MSQRQRDRLRGRGTHPVLEDVIAHGEHRGGDGEDGLRRPATVLDTQELRAQVGLFGAHRGPGRVEERGLEPEGAGRVRVDGRWRSRPSVGRDPAHETRWPAVGKRVMSRPTSATTMTRAHRLADARHGDEALDGGGPKGARVSPRRASTVRRAASSPSIGARCSGCMTRWWPVTTPRRAPTSEGRAAVSRPRARSASRSGSGSPAITAPRMARPLTPRS